MNYITVFKSAIFYSLCAKVDSYLQSLSPFVKYNAVAKNNILRNVVIPVVMMNTVGISTGKPLYAQGIVKASDKTIFNKRMTTI